MKVLIRKASDDHFEEEKKVSKLLKKFFKKLEKEFECSSFIVEMDPIFEDEYEVQITIYDDYVE